MLPMTDSGKTVAVYAIKLSLWLPVTTLLQGLPGLGNVNRICMALLLCLIALDVVTSRMSLGGWVTLLCTLALYGFALTETKGPLYNTNDLVYFAAWVLFLLFAAARMDFLLSTLRANAPYLRLLLVIWHGLVLLSALFPASYLRTVEGVYFVSFTGTGFRLAPSALFTMTLALVYRKLTSRHAAMGYMLLPLACAYLNGSRTYAGVILLLFFCAFYTVLKRKVWLVPLCGILVVLVFVSPVMNKITATSYTQGDPLGPLGTVTSGRTIFWRAELVAFAALPALQKLTGGGFNLVYAVNQQAVGTAIWAHNDFLSMLLSHGILGLACYLYSLFALFRASTLWLGPLPWPLRAGFFSIWFVNAFFNMVYTYPCAMLALPFLLIGLGLREEERP